MARLAALVAPPALRGRDHRVMCSLVHHVSADPSGSRRSDGRTRIGRVSQDDLEVGNPVRAGVREAMVKQDHRAVKRRCVSMLGFKSFGNAAITFAGIEMAHRIHKRLFSFGPGRQWRAQSLKRLWVRALATA